MEETKTDDNVGARSRITVFQLDTEGVPTVQQQQTMQTDSVLRSLSPIINSMRLFGLYFTREERVNCETMTAQGRQLARRCRSWNFSRIHSTVVLVVMWLHAVRYVFMFDTQETLGALLFVKLAILSAGALNTVLQTTYYVASHTGSLDRVLRQMNLSMADLLTKYSRRAKVVTAICWLYFAWNMFNYSYEVFVDGRHGDHTLMLLRMSLPERYLSVMTAVFVILQLQIIGTWTFSQGMNFMVMSFLYDQFNKLSDEFSKCIGDRGEFSGNFEQFRRRHQAVSRSVQEADRFLMISNGGNLVVHIVSVIFVLYSLIFFREDTVALHPVSAIVNIAWLSLSVLSLSLSAGQAIYLNHTESILL